LLKDVYELGIVKKIYEARAEGLLSRGRCYIALTYKEKAVVMEFKAGASAEEGIKQIEEI